MIVVTIVPWAVHKHNQHGVSFLLTFGNSCSSHLYWGVYFPYAEYEDRTIMQAYARLIEYQKGAVLFEERYGTW